MVCDWLILLCISRLPTYKFVLNNFLLKRLYATVERCFIGFYYFVRWWSHTSADELCGIEGVKTFFAHLRSIIMSDVQWTIYQMMRDSLCMMDRWCFVQGIYFILLQLIILNRARDRSCMKFSDRVKLSSSTVKYETIQQDGILKIVIMYMYINVIVLLSILLLTENINCLSIEKKWFIFDA